MFVKLLEKQSYNSGMNTTKSKRGGWRGVPKKSLSGSGTSPTLRVVMPQEMIDKVKRNGGAAWVRALVDAAQEAEQHQGR